MKKILMAALFGISSISFAGQNESDKAYSANVGVTVVVRSIVEKKLVDSETTKLLKLALETGTVVLGEMTCDRATGNDYCTIDVTVKDDESTKEAEESLYQLSIRIIQGEVISAELNLIAG